MIDWIERKVDSRLSDLRMRVEKQARTGAKHLSPLSHKQFIEICRDLFTSDYSRYHAVLSFELRPAMSRVSVLDAVMQVVAKHEALRTSYVVTESLELKQAVHSDPSFDLIEERLNPQAASLNEACVALHERLLRSDYQLEADRTVRIGLVRTRSDVQFLLARIHYSVVDGHALELLHQDFKLALAGQLDPRTPDWTPAAQALEERSALGRARSQRAIAYIRRIYDTAPPQVFTSARGSGSGFIELRSSSRRLAHDLRRIEKDAGVTSATVTMAAYGTAIALVLGDFSPLLSVFFSNRTSARAREFCGGLMQQVPIQVSVRMDSAFSTIVRDVQKSTIPAYRCATYDPTDVYEAIHGAELRRGIDLRRELWFNYMRKKHAPVSRSEDILPMKISAVVHPAQEGRPDLAATIRDHYSLTDLSIHATRSVVSDESAISIYRLMIDLVAGLAAGEVPTLSSLAMTPPRSIAAQGLPARSLTTHREDAPNPSVWAGENPAALVSDHSEASKSGGKWQRLTPLETTVQRVISPRRVRPDESYLQQGGPASRIPGIVLEMRKEGYCHMKSTPLLEHQSLKEVWQSLSAIR